MFLHVTFQADFGIIGGAHRKSILHILLDQNHQNEDQGKYEKCLDYIFSEYADQKRGVKYQDHTVTDLAEIINHMDENDNVPLHYATNYWDQHIVSKLFENGAISSVGIENSAGEQPISKIKPKVS